MHTSISRQSCEHCDCVSGVVCWLHRSSPSSSSDDTSMLRSDDSVLSVWPIESSLSSLMIIFCSDIVTSTVGWSSFTASSKDDLGKVAFSPSELILSADLRVYLRCPSLVRQRFGATTTIVAAATTIKENGNKPSALFVLEGFDASPLANMSDWAGRRGCRCQNEGWREAILSSNLRLFESNPNDGECSNAKQEMRSIGTVRSCHRRDTFLLPLRPPTSCNFQYNGSNVGNTNSFEPLTVRILWFCMSLWRIAQFCERTTHSIGASWIRTTSMIANEVGERSISIHRVLDAPHFVGCLARHQSSNNVCWSYRDRNMLLSTS